MRSCLKQQQLFFLSFKGKQCWLWHANPRFGKWKHEDQECKGILSYVVNLRPACAISDHVSASGVGDKGKEGGYRERKGRKEKSK